MRRAVIRTLIAASLFLAAASLGYFLTSSLGQEVLRQETEQQLSRLMGGAVSIERTRLVFDLGLRIEGEQVEVYPGEGGPALEARRVDAVVDAVSLLLGSFRLRSLRVEGVVMRIERDADGFWSPYPLAVLQGKDDPDPSDPERHLDPIRAFEACAQALLERPIVADLVELEDGSVEMLDWSPRGADEPPVALRLESVRGHWDHRWWSNEPELSLRATLIDERERRTRVEAEGHRLDANRLRWVLASDQLPLDVFQPYAKDLGAQQLDGTVSGALAFETRGPESDAVEIDWVLDDAGLVIPWRGETARLGGERFELRAQLKLHPARVRLSSLHLSAADGEIDMSGHIERPLRDSSRSRLVIDVVGLDLSELREILQGLPPVDRDTFLEILEPIERGDLLRVRASASTRLTHWAALAERRRLTLPRGFLISAQIENALLRTGAARIDAIDDLAGVLEWSGDRLAARGVTGIWRGESLPRLDLSIDGVSSLFESGEEYRTVRAGADPIPGLNVLSEWLTLRRAEGDGEPYDWPRLHLELDELNHPATFWPLRNMKLTFQLRPGVLEMAVPSGEWAGAPVRGEAIWFLDPEDERLSASLFVARPPTTPRPITPPSEAMPWLKGRLRSEPLEDGPLAYEGLVAEIRAYGSRLALDYVDTDLVGDGRLTGNLGLDLGHDDGVPIELSAQLFDGDVSRLIGLFDLPPETATGRVRISAALSGDLVPEALPWSSASGHASFEALDGQIRQRVPLVVTMAKATEGFNPFSDEEAVDFESIRSEIVFTHGVMETEEFRLEGPMRVFASGSLDLREVDPTIDAVVGVFLLRQADLMLGEVPIVNWLISDKGIIGAYYALSGPVGTPEVDMLEARTIVEQFPDAIKAPFRVLRYILSGGRSNGLR